MSNLLQSIKKQSSRVLNQMTNPNNNNNSNHDNDGGDTAALELQPGGGGGGGKSERFVNEPSSAGTTDNEEDDDSQQVLMQQQQQQSSSSWAEELSEYCPKLTFQERLIGFATTFGLGYLIAFFSFRFFIKLIEGNPIPFALNYTAGHVLQLLSSMFLCGPQRQFRLMFDSTRYVTSMVYLCCLAVTLVLVFIPLRPHVAKLLLLIGLTTCQFGASCWYSLSYIPYGRRTALRFIYKTLGLTPPPSTNTNSTNLSLTSLFRGGGTGGTTCTTTAVPAPAISSSSQPQPPPPQRENSLSSMFQKVLS
ncbi:hypothetical protein ACA910_011530 [Epithemia clementina (nom. ined.)]